MKNLFILFAVMCIAMVACTSNSTKNAETTVDTTVVDSTLVDTISIN